MKIYVAGHRGLVGSALVRDIEANGLHTWVGKSRSELDLFDSKAVESFIGKEQPDAIIIAAAKVGGIGANSASPVDFLTENLKIQTNLLESAHKLGINRVLFLGSSCIYPKFAAQPIVEESLLTGALEITNEAYALAKIVGVKLIEAYSRQFKRDWISAMPTNIYGPGDNFNPSSGHVLPSLISKFHAAKVEKAQYVELWGDGSPLREFLHSDDLAEACLLMLESWHDFKPVNIGSGVEIRIDDLAHLIKQVVGFEGEIRWNQDFPNGTPRKILDSSKIMGLGWQPRIALEDGVRSTYASFLKTH